MHRLLVWKCQSNTIWWDELPLGRQFGRIGGCSAKGVCHPRPRGPLRVIRYRSDQGPTFWHVRFAPKATVVRRKV